MQDGVVIKVSSDIVDKKLICKTTSTARDVAKDFAERANLHVKGKKFYLKNGLTNQVFADSELLFNVPEIGKIPIKFVMEERSAQEATEEEEKLMESLEGRNRRRTMTVAANKNDFSLKLPKFKMNDTFDFELWDFGSSSGAQGLGGKASQTGYGTAVYDKEKKVETTSDLQNLDFGFGEYDVKTMAKFEFEAVLDATEINIIHNFDPKQVNYLDFVAGVLRICETCKEGIEFIDVVSSFGKLYHKRCLRCTHCNQDFTRLIVKDGEDGKSYCENHWYDTFAAKCASCGDPIREDPATAMGKKWHPRCFICTTCNEVLDSKAFFSLKGAPYCEHHFYEEQNLICPVCELPIKAQEDLIDPKRGDKFHKDHYKCSYCRKHLEIDQLYKTVDKKSNKIYCAPCCFRLYGV